MKNSILLSVLVAVALSTFSGMMTQAPAQAANFNPHVNHQYAALKKADRESMERFERMVDGYVSRGDFAGLMNFCTEVIAKDNQNAEAYYYRALCSDQLGHDVAVVLADLSRAIEVDHKFIAALDARSSIFEATGDLRGAIEDYTRMLVILPDSLEVLSRLTNAHMKVGDWQAVVEDGNYGIMLNSYNADSYYVRAIGHLNLGEIGLAITDLKQTRELFARQNRRADAEKIVAMLARLEREQSVG